MWGFYAQVGFVCQGQSLYKRGRVYIKAPFICNKGSILCTTAQGHKEGPFLNNKEGSTYKGGILMYKGEGVCIRGPSNTRGSIFIRGILIYNGGRVHTSGLSKYKWEPTGIYTRGSLCLLKQASPAQPSQPASPV